MIILNDQQAKKTQGAYGTKLTCPSIVPGLGGIPELCMASNWRFVEKLGPCRVRYKCRACGKTIQYDFSAIMDHPYAAFGKSKWRRIVENWKSKKGHASLGNYP